MFVVHFCGVCSDVGRNVCSSPPRYLFWCFTVIIHTTEWHRAADFSQLFKYWNINYKYLNMVSLCMNRGGSWNGHPQIVSVQSKLVPKEHFPVLGDGVQVFSTMEVCRIGSKLYTTVLGLSKADGFYYCCVVWTSFKISKFSPPPFFFSSN